MSLFDTLGRNTQQQNPQALIQQMQQNPAAMLQQRGLNIPQGMNNPQQIVNHLIRTGQVPQTRLAQVMQMLGRR